MATGREPGKVKLGYTLAELDAVYEAAKGYCAICGRKPERKQLALDHCHETGKLRGLLCVQCNTGLGMFKDDAALLRQAI